MRKMGLKLMTAVMMLACVTVVPAFAKDATTITIFHTNDIHGNVKDNGKDSIGFAKFASFVGAERETENVLVLDAGDMFQGLPFANLENGHSIIDLANAVGYDAMTTGNHEFDFGAENLFSIASKLNYPMLAANLYKGNERALDAYIVKEIDGVKVGVFGMATEETAFKTHPDNVKGYAFTDMIAEAQTAVKALKEKEGVDVIIMLAHLGLDEGDYTSDLVAEQVEGIDVIIDGHSHTTLENGRMVNGTLIASTGTAFKNVGRVELSVEDGKVEAKTASLMGYDAFSEVEPKAEVLEAIEKVEATQKPLLEKVVGTAAVKLEGTRGIVRTGESNLGQLATNAMLDLTGAQVALTNGGGIRASIEAGNITMNDMVTVFPFGNTIMVKEIKGSDLKAALEHGVSEYPNEKGAFPHTAGITFTLNAYKEVGNRISDLKVAGEAIDLNKMYTVATNDFMAAGGDDYTMFKAYPIKAEYNTLMDTLLAYVEKLGTVTGEVETRMTVVTEAPVDENTSETVVNEVVALRTYLTGEGFEVKYNKANKQITAVKGDVVLTFNVGQKAYVAQDQDSNIAGKLQTAVEIKNDVTYINKADVAIILKALAA